MCVCSYPLLFLPFAHNVLPPGEEDIEYLEELPNPKSYLTLDSAEEIPDQKDKFVSSNAQNNTKLTTGRVKNGCLATVALPRLLAQNRNGRNVENVSMFDVEMGVCRCRVFPLIPGCYCIQWRWLVMICVRLLFAFAHFTR